MIAIIKTLSVSQLMALASIAAYDPAAALGDSLLEATPCIPILAGHRVTLTRPRFLRRPLVIRTNANPSHADALRDLRAMFQATTGRPYLPRRGDTLIHTF